MLHYEARHHFACGVERKKQRHPSKQAVAGCGLSQYLHKLSQLLYLAGALEGKDSQHILLHTAAFNQKQQLSIRNNDKQS